MRPEVKLHRSSSSLCILLLAALAFLPGCGGGSSGSGGGTPAPQTPAALVVGSASGAVYDELASSYQVANGSGNESASGYDVLIYDGATTSADQIENLPTTNNFLAAGKIMIILKPTPEDRQALDELLGGTDLVDDSPAVAVFNTFSKRGLLQEIDMVEFPADVNEDPVQTIPPGPSSESSIASASTSAPVDEQTLREQTRRWRSIYEAARKSDKAAFAGLDNVSSAQLAAAAADNGSTQPLALGSGSPNGDLSQWLALPSEITPSSDTTQFLTAQPLKVTLPYTFHLQSIYYQPRFQPLYPNAVTPQTTERRGLCTFLPIKAVFDIPSPSETLTNVIAQVQTYRLLERNNDDFTHEVIAHQFVTSQPTVTGSPQPMGNEIISYCRAMVVNRMPPPVCGPDAGGCNAFDWNWPISSLRGFNEQIVSSFTWDPGTGPLLNLFGWVPKADNDKITVSSSQTYEKTVTWSIQASAGPFIDDTPRIGLSLDGNYGQNERWEWNQGTSMSLSAWRLLSPGPVDVNFPARSLFDFRASMSPNNLDNMVNFSNVPATSDTSPLSYSRGLPDGINRLQEEGLTDRNESDWTVRSGGLLPPNKAVLNVNNTYNYGEVYGLYTLTKTLSAGVRSYSALHTYSPGTIPIQLDFSQPMMQLPVPAEWTLTADRNPKPDAKGFFPIDGTVTLNQAADIDTILYLGAQIEKSGIHRPAPTAINGLPPKLTIPAGQMSATFTTGAQRTGFPYNVQFYAYQTQGKQAVYPMTIPAK